MATGSRMIPDQPRSPGPPPHHLSLHCAKFTPHVFLGLFLRLNLSLQLSVLHLTQDFSDNQPRLIAHLQQIVPAKQTWRSHLLCPRLRQRAADQALTLPPPTIRSRRSKPPTPVVFRIILKLPAAPRPRSVLSSAHPARDPPNPA